MKKIILTFLILFLSFTFGLKSHAGFSDYAWTAYNLLTPCSVKSKVQPFVNATQITRHITNPNTSFRYVPSTCYSCGVNGVLRQGNFSNSNAYINSYSSAYINNFSNANYPIIIPNSYNPPALNSLENAYVSGYDTYIQEVNQPSPNVNNELLKESLVP